MLIAGGLMGGISILLPQVMGIGYDSVEMALNGGFLLGLLAALLVGKLLATACCIGLGVPGGMIGPALFIGAMLGALVAGSAMSLPLGVESPVGFYALLGMGAMMSGSLQAPLAALTAMLELTDNPDIILPGMLVVVAAGITASAVFGKDSLFLTMLRAGGLDYQANPMFQALRRIGVGSVMERGIARVGAVIDPAAARALLASNPLYLLIDAKEDEPELVMPAVELAKYLESLSAEGASTTIDLRQIPGERLLSQRIDLRANLQQAWEMFERDAVEALVVERMTAPGIHRVYGVLTRDTVERAYRY
jgi:hypothetical protein